MPVGRSAGIALAVALALVVAGCGGGSSSVPQGGGSGSASTPSGSSSTTVSGTGSGPSAAVTVEGVRLTAQGSQLQLGHAAKVTWRPDQHTVGVISVAVTRLQRMPISAFSDWRLDRSTRRSTPYFVHATVRNLGRSNLSGQAVPLYLLDQANTLLQASTFQAQYAPCPSRPLPARFTHGKRTSVCLVYFAPHHGRLVAISFRPTQSFQAITWKGALTRPAKKK